MVSTDYEEFDVESQPTRDSIAIPKFRCCFTFNIKSENIDNCCIILPIFFFMLFIGSFIIGGFAGETVFNIIVAIWICIFSVPVIMIIIFILVYLFFLIKETVKCRCCIY